VTTNPRRHAFPLSLVVVTLLYVTVLGLLVLRPVKSGYAGLPDPGGEVDVPIDCVQTRGSPDGYQVASLNNKTYCFYSLSRVRVLYPEYADMSDRQLVPMLYQQAGLPSVHVASFFEIAFFRLAIRFPFSIPMLIGGGFLVRAIVRATRPSRSAA
jgi:hypothetical protein